MKEKLESTLVGVAGEYLVAGELTLRGHIAPIPIRISTHQSTEPEGFHDQQNQHQHRGR